MAQDGSNVYFYIRWSLMFECSISKVELNNQMLRMLTFHHRIDVCLMLAPTKFTYVVYHETHQNSI